MTLSSSSPTPLETGSPGRSPEPGRSPALSPRRRACLRGATGRKPSGAASDPSGSRSPRAARAPGRRRASGPGLPLPALPPPALPSWMSVRMTLAVPGGRGGGVSVGILRIMRRGAASSASNVILTDTSGSTCPAEVAGIRPYGSAKGCGELSTGAPLPGAASRTRPTIAPWTTTSCSPVSARPGAPCAGLICT